MLFQSNVDQDSWLSHNSVGVLHLLGLVYKQMGDLENDSPFPCHLLPSGVNNLPMTPDLTERYLHHAFTSTCAPTDFIWARKRSDFRRGALRCSILIYPDGIHLQYASCAEALPPSTNLGTRP